VRPDGSGSRAACTVAQRARFHAIRSLLPPMLLPEKPPLGEGSMMRYTRTSLLLLALALSRFTPCSAQCTSLKAPRSGVAESIHFVYEPAVPREWVEEAVGYWSSCPNYGQDFPRLVQGRGGVRTLAIRYEARSPRPKCASLHRVTVTLYAFATNERGQVVPCRSLPQNLAHEFGHALGLKDAPRENACRFHIMAQVRRDNAGRRRVSREECQIVGRKWLTSTERE
jgi:hypothetical protein